MKAWSFYHQTHLLIFLHFRPEMSTQLFRKSHMLQLRYLLVPMGPGNETPLKISQNGVVFPLSPQCFTFFVPRVLLPAGKKQTSATVFFHQNSAKNSNGNFSETKHLLIQAFSTHPSWTCPKPQHFHEVFIIIPKKEGSDFYHTTNSNNDMFRSGTNQCPSIGRLSFIPWPDIKVCNFER